MSIFDSFKSKRSTIYRFTPFNGDEYVRPNATGTGYYAQVSSYLVGSDLQRLNSAVFPIKEKDIESFVDWVSKSKTLSVSEYYSQCLGVSGVQPHIQVRMVATDEVDIPAGWQARQTQGEDGKLYSAMVNGKQVYQNNEFIALLPGDVAPENIVLRKEDFDPVQSVTAATGKKSGQKPARP